MYFGDCYQLNDSLYEVVNSVELCAFLPKTRMPQGRTKYHPDMERALFSDPRGFCKKPKNFQIYDTEEIETPFNSVTKTPGKTLPKILEATCFQRKSDPGALSRLNKNVKEYLGGIAEKQVRERARTSGHRYLKKQNLIFTSDNMWSDEMAAAEAMSKKYNLKQREKKQPKQSAAPHDHHLDISTTDIQKEITRQTKDKSPRATGTMENTKSPPADSDAIEKTKSPRTAVGAIKKTKSPPPSAGAIEKAKPKTPADSADMEKTKSPPTATGAIKKIKSPPPAAGAIEKKKSSPADSGDMEKTISPPTATGAIKKIKSPPPAAGAIEKKNSSPADSGDMEKTKSSPTATGAIKKIKSPPPAAGAIEKKKSPPADSGNMEKIKSTPTATGAIKQIKSPPPADGTIEKTKSPPADSGDMEKTKSTPTATGAIKKIKSPPPAAGAIEKTKSPPAATGAIKITKSPPTATSAIENTNSSPTATGAIERTKSPRVAVGVTVKTKAKKNKKSAKNRKSKATKTVSQIANLPDLFEDSVALGKSSDEPIGAAKTDTGPSEDLHENQMLTPEDFMTPGVDILIKIRIYKPFDYSELQNAPDKNSCHLLYHDLVLTGRHKVFDIKEAFICTERNPDFQAKSNNGFLFIKNAFYVDNEGPATKQADSLREICISRKFGEFPRHNMRDVRMDELDFKLGNPDVYIHDDTCEHIIIFSQVSLVTAHDPVFMAEYPHMTPLYQNQRTPFCYNCAGLDPKWIVSGCLRIPFNKALFCEDCLKKLLYGNDGKKRCNFKAYPYDGGDEMELSNL